MLLTVSVLSALPVLPSGCVTPLSDDERSAFTTRELTLRLYLPQNVPATKAETGNVDGVSPESQVYSVQVWMFNHYAANVTTGDNEKAVAYSEASNINSGSGWTNDPKNLDGSGYYPAGRWTDGSIYEIPLSIPGYVLDRADADMRFDFYVLANGSSIGSPAARTMTRKQIKDLVFGKDGSTDYFGATTPRTGTTPILALGQNGPGLPISGFFNRGADDTDSAASGVDLSFLKPETFKNLSLDQIRAKTPVVQLERAVSKVRFVFAMPTLPSGTTTSPNQIVSIKVDGTVVPNATYVFPREDGTPFQLPGTPAYGTSGTGDVTVAVPASIGQIIDPNYLRSTCDSTFTIGTKTYVEPKNMTAQEYDSFLNDAVSAGNATESYLYLRESDRPVKGTITYTVDGGTTTQTASFYMPSDAAGAANTNFHRNHSWIVYAYFQGDGLYIKPVVLPWQDGTSYTYTQRGSAVVAISDGKESIFGYGWTTSNSNDWWLTHQNDDPAAKTEWYFRRQDEDYTSNWAYDWIHSQVVSAPGLNAGGVPVYANRIELRTSGFNVPLRLKLSSTDDFYVVTYNSSNAEYVSWISGSALAPTGWTEADGALIPQEVSAGGTTYFYVVPKDDASHEGKTVELYLVTDPTDGSGSQKIPFNAGVFPGSEDNTDIHFYSVSSDTFNSYYTSSRPANVKPYDQSGEVTI